MTRIATVGGITGVASLAVGVGLPKVTDTLPIWVHYGFVAFGGVLLLVTFVFWSLFNKGDAQGAGQAQTSHGFHSPNYGTVGVVHNHFAPTLPAIHEREQAVGRYTAPVVAALREELPQSPNTGAMPDMSLAEVLTRLHERFGPTSDEREGALDELDMKIHETIVDAAFHRHVEVWGRMAPGKPAKLVWREAWEGGQFSVSNNEVVYRSPDNPRSAFRWKGLMFNRCQVDRLWPRDLGPNGWMAG